MPTYRVRVTSWWEGHPPADPHTGNWLVATHPKGQHIFQEGKVASPAVAETAMFGTLDGFPTFRFQDTHPVVPSPFKNVELVVDADERSSQLSLISMVAPSSDFFFGLDSVPLKGRRGNWKRRIMEPVFAYDAGSDPRNRFQNNPPGTPIQTRDPIRRLRRGVPIPFGMAVIERIA